MSKPKIKEIKKISEAEGTDDEYMFLLSYNEEMTQIMVTLTARRAVTPEEYMQALAEFVDEVSEHPHNLFVETVDRSDDMGFH